jgi:pilus assembly protein Flp/PilA
MAFEPGPDARFYFNAGVRHGELAMIDRSLIASERNCTFCLPCSLGADQSGSAKDAVPRENPAFSSRKMFGKRRGSMRLLLNFLRDETGATAIEYGLIAAGISLAIISIINGLGTKLNTKFTAINSSLK